MVESPGDGSGGDGDGETAASLYRVGIGIGMGIGGGDGGGVASLLTHEGAMDDDEEYSPPIVRGCAAEGAQAFGRTGGGSGCCVHALFLCLIWDGSHRAPDCQFSMGKVHGAYIGFLLPL